MTQASAAQLPFADARFNLVTSFDVIYSLEDAVERAAIGEMFRVLKPGGTLILNVAALEALRGNHSVLSGEVRRYSKPDLRRRLEGAGFRTFMPRGAYYVMTDISGFGFPDDIGFARHLVAEGGVAAVPGSSFYSDPAAGRQRLRFHFARRRETLEAAVERLGRLKARAPAV